MRRTKWCAPRRATGTGRAVADRRAAKTGPAVTDRRGTGARPGAVGAGPLPLLLLLPLLFLPLLLLHAVPPPARPTPGGLAAGRGTVPAAAPVVPMIAAVWPVGTRPPVTRGWEPPATAYGPGHRGVDLATAAGARVRSVAAGRVSFAGRVAGRGVVSVALAGTSLRTTYEPVSATVLVGDEVAAGAVVGTVEATGSHCATACLHWGLLSGETYLDPLALLPPWLRNSGPSRLLPVPGTRPRALPAAREARPRALPAPRTRARALLVPGARA